MAGWIARRKCRYSGNLPPASADNGPKMPLFAPTGLAGAHGRGIAHQKCRYFGNLPPASADNGPKVPLFAPPGLAGAHGRGIARRKCRYSRRRGSLERMAGG